MLPFYGLSPVFQVRAITALGVPEKFTARRDDGRVTLTWAAITCYEYRHAAGTSMPSGTTWNSAGMAQSVTVMGLMNGTEYTFEARAVNSVEGGSHHLHADDAGQQLRSAGIQRLCARIFQARAELHDRTESERVHAGGH